MNLFETGTSSRHYEAKHIFKAKVYREIQSLAKWGVKQGGSHVELKSTCCDGLWSWYTLKQPLFKVMFFTGCQLPVQNICLCLWC